MLRVIINCFLHTFVSLGSINPRLFIMEFLLFFVSEIIIGAGFPGINRELSITQLLIMEEICFFPVPPSPLLKMYYYIHFVRPPPLQCLPSKPMTISVSIMNDLRTESLRGEKDIFYAWVKSSNPTDDERPRSLGAMTPPLKLTTWSEANAYKELLIFPPKDTREGDYWKLLLCTKPADAARYLTSVDMSGNTFGTSPFPVLSMPVQFTYRHQGDSSAGRLQKTISNTKQVQNERIIKLPVLWNTPVSPLRVLEHISYDLDKVNCSIYLNRMRLRANCNYW